MPPANLRVIYAPCVEDSTATIASAVSSHLRMGRAVLVAFAVVLFATPAARTQGNGIDLKGWRGGIVSAAHSEDDVELTLDAWRKSLKALREESELPG